MLSVEVGALLACAGDTTFCSNENLYFLYCPVPQTLLVHHHEDGHVALSSHCMTELFSCGGCLGGSVS